MHHSAIMARSSAGGVSEQRRQAAPAAAARAASSVVAVVFGLACCSVVSHAFVPPSPSVPSATNAAVRTTPLPQQQLQPRRATAATALFSMRPGDEMMGGGDGGGGGMGSGAGRGSSLSPVNQVILIGNLGSEPSLRYLDNGNCVLEVSLAVSKDQAPGRAAMGEQREVDWIRLTAWGRVAESLAQRAHKGSRMMVVGALTSSSWTDKYGQNRSDVKVRVKRAEILQSNRGPANPQLTYNAGWDESSGAGSSSQGLMMDDASAGYGGGGGYQPMRGGGGSPYARRGGSSSSPYAKRKTGGSSGSWGSSGGGVRQQYGGGGGYGGGYAAMQGSQQQQAPQMQSTGQEPPPYDSLGEFEVDTDIPF